jgi:hypothetical protein
MEIHLGLFFSEHLDGILRGPELAPRTRMCRCGTVSGLWYSQDRKLFYFSAPVSPEIHFYSLRFRQLHKYSSTPGTSLLTRQDSSSLVFVEEGYHLWRFDIRTAFS